MRWAPAFMVLAFWVGCGRETAPSAPARQENTKSDGATLAPASTVARPLDAIVDDWVAGRREGAVKRLVAEVPSTASVEARRLYSISESEFAAKPAAERDALRDSAATRTSALLQVAREALRQARSLTADGNDAGARAILETLRAIGDANRGPDVMAILDLAGRKIFEEADQALASLDAPLDSHVGSKTP